MEIVVKQNWGPRFVVRGDDGQEEVLWGKDLRLVDKEGKGNPHGLQDPYDAMRFHAWNRKRLRKYKTGSLIERRVCNNTVSPTGCSGGSKTTEWKKAKVLRVVRSGGFNNEVYTVALNRFPPPRHAHIHSLSPFHPPTRTHTHTRARAQTGEYTCIV